MNTIDGTTGQVTIADLFRVMSNIQTDLARAITKLEVIDSRNANADKIHDDFEHRLRAVETAKAKIWGASLSIGTIAGVLSGYLSTLHH